VLLTFDVSYRGDYMVTLRAPLTLYNRLPLPLNARWLTGATTLAGSTSGAPAKRIVAADTLAVASRHDQHLLPSARACALQLRVGAYDWSPVRAPFFVETLSRGESAAAGGGGSASSGGGSSTRHRSGSGAPTHHDTNAADVGAVSGVRRAQFVCMHRDERQHTLTLMVDIELRGASFVATVYAPWWLVNRIGQPVRYRAASKRVLPRDAVARDIPRLPHGQPDVAAAAVDNNENDADGALLVMYSDRRVAVSLGDHSQHWSCDGMHTTDDTTTTTTTQHYISHIVVDLRAVANAGVLELHQPNNVDAKTGRYQNI
jgi:hypothetical protein